MSCLQYWLLWISAASIGIVALLSFFGGCLTKRFLGTLGTQSIKRPEAGEGVTTNGDDPIPVATLVDLDLQLEQFHRGRCIVQFGLLLVAVIAIVCATMLAKTSSPTVLDDNSNHYQNKFAAADASQTEANAICVTGTITVAVNPAQPAVTNQNDQAVP